MGEKQEDGRTRREPVVEASKHELIRAITAGHRTMDGRRRPKKKRAVAARHRLMDGKRYRRKKKLKRERAKWRIHIEETTITTREARKRAR